MKSYKVIWEIDLDAESPEDAAREALRIQQNPQSTTVFEVHRGRVTLVDLGEEECSNWQ